MCLYIRNIQKRIVNVYSSYSHMKKLLKSTNVNGIKKRLSLDFARQKSSKQY